MSIHRTVPPPYRTRLRSYEEMTETSGGASTPSLQSCFDRIRALGLEPRDKKHHKKLKRASVLVLLFPRDDDRQQLYTLITKRSMNLRSHPGECCFPGGRQDEADDKDDVRTALREAQEEVGLEPDHVEVLGRLSTAESINHLCVTSIIARVKDSVISGNNFMEEYCWKINQDEVDQAFAVPLAFFLREPTSLVEVVWSREKFLLREYNYLDPASQRNFSVTGLTAHIAHEVASIAYTASPPEGNPSLKASKDNPDAVMSGTLWKREVSSRGRAYWTKRFFVFSRENAFPVLHQYDNEDQAKRKAQSATKKNRLPLNGCTVRSLDTLPTTKVDGQSDSKHEFVISALGGRIEWTLAGMSAETTEAWVKHLSLVV